MPAQGQTRFVDQLNTMGLSPLHTATLRGSASTVQALLQVMLLPTHVGRSATVTRVFPLSCVLFNTSRESLPFLPVFYHSLLGPGWLLILQGFGCHCNLSVN